MLPCGGQLHQACCQPAAAVATCSCRDHAHARRARLRRQSIKYTPAAWTPANAKPRGYDCQANIGDDCQAKLSKHRRGHTASTMSCGSAWACSLGWALKAQSSQKSPEEQGGHSLGPMYFPLQSHSNSSSLLALCACGAAIDSLAHPCTKSTARSLNAIRNKVEAGDKDTAGNGRSCCRPLLVAKYTVDAESKLDTNGTELNFSHLEHAWQR